MTAHGMPISQQKAAWLNRMTAQVLPEIFMQQRQVKVGLCEISLNVGKTIALATIFRHVKILKCL